MNAASSSFDATTLRSLKKQLAEDGYCVVPGFLTDDEVRGLRTATRRYPSELKGVTDAEYEVDWDGADRIRQIYNAEALNPDLDAIVRSDRSLELLTHVYGFDIGLYHAKFVLKDPGGSDVPYHQDFAYWTRQSEYPCQINCMVYLDDADEENGCLVLVPGSHALGLVPHAAVPAHGVFAAGLPEVTRPLARTVPGRAGTAILFSPLLHHASGPNRSSRPRHSYTAVYTNPLIDTHRDVFSLFFPQGKVKALSGRGPFRFCPEHYQRRNLWHLAVDHVTTPEWHWIEITDRTFSDGSFEWLSARKSPGSIYRRFEQFPLVASNRDDVVVLSGSLPDALHDLEGPCGLVFLDCERATNARTALRALEPCLRKGTVLVLDNFYGCPGWQWGTYREFQDFVIDARLGFEYLGRAPQHVALRLTDGAPCSCPDVNWVPVSRDIAFE